jgi:ABC-type spermidine/putrescine transport system permease subunit I
LIPKSSEHIILKFFAVLIVIVLLIPSFAKIGHVFENHKHEVCVNKATTHFHTLDLECEFYKFNVSSEFTFNTISIESITLSISQTLITSQYSFISKYQKLHFSLRGPPRYS